MSGRLSWMRFQPYGEGGREGGRAGGREGGKEGKER